MDLIIFFGIVSYMYACLTTSKLGKAWMRTNKALWPLHAGFVPEKGSKIDPKSMKNGSEMTQKRLEKRSRNAQDNTREKR